MTSELYPSGRSGRRPLREGIAVADVVGVRRLPASRDVPEAAGTEEQDRHPAEHEERDRHRRRAGRVDVGRDLSRVFRVGIRVGVAAAPLGMLALAATRDHVRNPRRSEAKTGPDRLRSVDKSVDTNLQLTVKFCLGIIRTHVRPTSSHHLSSAGLLPRANPLAMSRVDAACNNDCASEQGPLVWYGVEHE